jgi:hypothetical protein
LNVSEKRIKHISAALGGNEIQEWERLKERWWKMGKKKRKRRMKL